VVDGYAGDSLGGGTSADDLVVGEVQEHVNEGRRGQRSDVLGR
jgi:hypothetical protein